MILVRLFARVAVIAFAVLYIAFKPLIDESWMQAYSIPIAKQAIRGNQAMPTDMKQTIAQATMALLAKKGVKKLTVKDIVEQCHITRQAFYYHFRDIQDLLRWMIEKETDRMLRVVLAQESAEEGLRCFFVMAINALPYVKRGMDSNFGVELEQLMRQYMQQFFAQAAERENVYAGCSPAQSKLILRYHTQAILGLLSEWTEEDSEHVDEIVHTIYCLMTEGIPPKTK